MGDCRFRQSPTQRLDIARLLLRKHMSMNSVDAEMSTIPLLCMIVVSALQLTHHWTKLAYAPGVVVEADTSSVLRVRGFLYIWERLTVRSKYPRQSPQAHSQVVVARVELQCIGAESRTLAVITYQDDSTLKFDNFDNRRFSHILPNSPDETLFRYFCPRYANGPR